MDPNIHSSTIYNSQGMKTTQVLVPVSRAREEGCMGREEGDFRR